MLRERIYERDEIHINRKITPVKPSHLCISEVLRQFNLSEDNKITNTIDYPHRVMGSIDTYPLRRGTQLSSLYGLEYKLKDEKFRARMDLDYQWELRPDFEAFCLCLTHKDYKNGTEPWTEFYRCRTFYESKLPCNVHMEGCCFKVQRQKMYEMEIAAIEKIEAPQQKEEEFDW